MASTIKTQEDILAKLNIYELNEMQQNSISTVDKTTNTIILSPTGTGKTLSFLLPTLKLIDPNKKEVSDSNRTGNSRNGNRIKSKCCLRWSFDGKR